MSHAENKVDWCIKKAQKEIEEGKKHRGLVKRESDIEEARRHLGKAEHNLSAVEYFNAGGFSDWSMSAVFYCIYHCFLAIASKFGYESRNQECTIALIKFLNENKVIEFADIFVKTLETTNEPERHETNIIENREFYTYGTSTSAEKAKLQESIKLCKDCLAQTKEIIFK